MNPETTNEFEVDTPEAYAAAEAQANGEVPNQVTPGPDQPLPPADDISAEAPASEVTPEVPAPQAAPEAPVAPAAPVAATTVDRSTVIPGLKEDTQNSVEDRALATKRKLAAEPKVRMMIPLDPGEKAGAYRPVLINGYRFDVRKNTMVDLPESVASLLAASYSITTDIVENNPLNLAHASEKTQDALGV